MAFYKGSGRQTSLADAEGRGVVKEACKKEKSLGRGQSKTSGEASYQVETRHSSSWDRSEKAKGKGRLSVMRNYQQNS